MQRFQKTPSKCGKTEYVLRIIRKNVENGFIRLQKELNKSMVQVEYQYGRKDTGPAPSTYTSKMVFRKKKKSESALYKDRQILKCEIMDLELFVEAATSVYLFFE